MDRSFAGRLGIGGFTRQPARTAKSRKRRAPSRPARSRGPGRIDTALEAISRPLSIIGAHRRLRIALLVLLISTPLLAGGWLWLRQSSLVSVQHVHVSGAHGSDARAIDAALSSAARRMSTLEVHTAALRAAVAAYPVVRDVQVTPHFPHGLSIHVVEQPPVAALSAAGVRTAVAADGVVLGPAQLSGASLPSLAGTTALAAGEHVHDGTLLGALNVLGAAPAPFAKQVVRAYAGSKGLTLVMHSSLLVYFGDATRAHAKWLALAAVLAEEGSAGASYVDVRQPERPAAGFAEGAAPAESGAEAEAAKTAPTSSESSEALAEGLTSAVGAGVPATQSSEPEESTSSEASTSAEAETPPAGSGESSEASGTESAG